MTQQSDHDALIRIATSLEKMEKGQEAIHSAIFGTNGQSGLQESVARMCERVAKTETDAYNVHTEVFKRLTALEEKFASMSGKERGSQELITTIGAVIAGVGGIITIILTVMRFTGK